MKNCLVFNLNMHNEWEIQVNVEGPRKWCACVIGLSTLSHGTNCLMKNKYSANTDHSQMMNFGSEQEAEQKKEWKKLWVFFLKKTNLQTHIIKLIREVIYCASKEMRGTAQSVCVLCVCCVFVCVNILNIFSSFSFICKIIVAQQQQQ